jgi:hypothetical protein
VLLALLALGLMGGCGGGEGNEKGSPAAGAPHRDFFGLVSEDVYAGQRPYRERTLAMERRVGVRLLRQTFDWKTIEPSPGTYDFSYYDEYVSEAASHGMRLLAILFNPPPFRSSAPSSGARRGTYPPRRSGDMAAFASALARRYGPGGSLWKEHPHLRRVPIRSWQVWNEPNLPVYWPSGPDPAAYVRLLRATGRAIKRVDPGAEIVGAGLSQSRLGMPFRKFVTRMFHAGASDTLDTFALHPFARDAGGAIDAVESTRQLLHGLGEQTPIWITEFSWASGGPPSPFTLGERGQARNVREAMNDFVRRRRDLGIRGAIYFNWRDSQPYAGGHDFWGLHTGLLRENGSAKPVLGVFKRAARTSP